MKITKQNLILFLVLLVLGCIAGLLYMKKQREEAQLVKADRGFTVENINDVSKIVVRHVKLQPLVFTRKDGKWKINGKYNADQAVMVHIEKVLIGVRLLYVPPVNTTPTILKSVKGNGIQVDVYESDEDTPKKIIHIGSDTQNGDGTFMILGGSNQPFAMHLPGLSGGLRSRFEQPLENYRDKFIFQSTVDQIKTLKLVYPKSNLHSFLIDNTIGPSVYPLMEREQEKDNINKKLIQGYLTLFESLGAEKLMNQYPDKKRITQLIPSCSIELINKNGNTTLYQFYPYDDPENIFGPANSPGEIRQQNRLYVWVDSTDFYVVQNRVFGSIFRSYEDFLVR